MAINNLTPTGFDDSYNLQEPARWRPRIRSGYFYSHDRLLYLYGSKHTTTLRNLTVREYALPSVPVPGSLTVFIDGVQHYDFWTEGNKLYIHQLGPWDHHKYWTSLEDEKNRYGFYITDTTWDPGTVIQYRGTFITFDEVPPTIGTNYEPSTVPVTGYLTIPEDVRSEFYKFPSAYPIATGAPVVITDDTITEKDHRDYRIEHYADVNKQLLYTNTPRNLLQNPQFETNRYDLNQPDYWELYGVGLAHLYTPTDGAYAGTYGVRFDDYAATTDPSGGVYQDVDYDRKNLATVSARVSKGPDSGTAVGRLEIVYIDHTGAALDTDGAVIGSPYDTTHSTWSSEIILQNAGWEDVYIRLGEGSDLDPTGIPIPTNVQQVQVRLKGNNVVWDAAQFAEGTGVQFAYIDPSGTVEYETSSDGLYVPNPYTAGAEPFPDLINIELNGTISEAVNGFLTLQEFSDTDDSDLSIGGMVRRNGGAVGEADGEPEVPRGVVPTGIITANDVELGYVQFGRTHLPYAQVNGYNKQVESGELHTENFSFVPRFIATQAESEEPATFSVDGYSGSAYRRQTDDGQPALVLKADGTGELYAQLLDRNGNPIIGEEVRADAVYGTLDPTGVYTTQAGRAYFTYVAPGAAYTEDTVTFTHVASDMVSDVFIDLS